VSVGAPKVLKTGTTTLGGDGSWIMIGLWEEMDHGQSREPKRFYTRNIFHQPQSLVQFAFIYICYGTASYCMVAHLEPTNTFSKKIYVFLRPSVINMVYVVHHFKSDKDFSHVLKKSMLTYALKELQKS
jgi:hypothetical protein